MLKDVAGLGEQDNSHVVMSTHDPLVIAGLKRENVRIMQLGEETDLISANIPDEDPQGMGVGGLLRSDIYGLRSELDLETWSLLDRKRDLASKPSLSSEEKKELTDLNKELEGLDLTSSVRDPDYADFVEAKNRLEREQGLHEAVLTKEQKTRQKQLALDVLKEIKAKEERED